MSVECSSSYLVSAFVRSKLQPQIKATTSPSPRRRYWRHRFQPVAPPSPMDRPVWLHVPPTSTLNLSDSLQLRFKPGDRSSSRCPRRTPVRVSSMVGRFRHSSERCRWIPSAGCLRWRLQAKRMCHLIIIIPIIGNIKRDRLRHSITRVSRRPEVASRATSSEKNFTWQSLYVLKVYHKRATYMHCRCEREFSIGLSYTTDQLTPIMSTQLLTL